MDEDELHPAEAFDVLGDETRVAILETLADDNGLSFSELRERVGVRDAGQFNYHLSKLRDRFVAKRDDGYYPRYAALRAVGAIHSGSYTDAPATRTAESDSVCPDCEHRLTTEYDDGFFALDCPEHETVVQTAVPPSVAEDRTLAEMASYVHAEVQRDVERAVDGTCFICRGRVEVTDRWRGDGGRLHVSLDCESCWLAMQFPLAAAVVRHPAVVSLYHDHGVDVRTELVLSLEFVQNAESVTVLDEEPFRARIDVTVSGDSLSLTLDGGLNVVSVEES